MRTIKEAAAALNMEYTAESTLADITRAFARAVQATHPDTSGTSQQDAQVKVSNIQLAREMLRKHCESGLPLNQMECRKCDGKGFLRAGGFKGSECPICKGQGVVEV